MGKKKLTQDEIPELPGYLPVAAISARYGVHKGTIYYMIYHQRLFRHVYKISTGVDDKRPLLLILEQEVDAVFAARVQSAATVKNLSAAQLLQQWNRRVKQWGTDQGWTDTRIFPSGPPNKALVEAYLADNPEDPSPAE